MMPQMGASESMGAQFSASQQGYTGNSAYGQVPPTYEHPQTPPSQMSGAGTYDDDFIEAVMAAIKTDHEGVINIGSGKAKTTNEIAQLIKEITSSESELGYNEINSYHPGIEMDISFAARILGWSPKTELREGLTKIVNHLS